jgi:DNA (cytosine-5)-methyltransferase 1
VFVVGYLGDWRPAAAVLFEPESVRGDSPPSRKAGQKVAGTFKARANSGGWGSDVELAAAEYMQPVAQCLTRGVGQRYDPETESLIPQPIALSDISSRDKTQNGKGWKDDGTMYTLDTTGLQGVAQPVVYDIHGITATSGATKTDIHTPLRARRPGQSEASRTTVIAQPAAAFKYTMGAKARGIGYAEEQSPTFDTKPDSIAVMAQMAVRRLTPVECERLQGFPDGYTNIPWRKAIDSPDGPRYKALGNSMAVPVMNWIGKRIELQMPKPAG